MNRVKHIEREDLLMEKNDNQESKHQIISEITKYIPQCNDLANVVKKEFILQASHFERPVHFWF